MLEEKLPVIDRAFHRHNFEHLRVLPLAVQPRRQRGQDRVVLAVAVAVEGVLEEFGAAGRLRFLDAPARRRRDRVDFLDYDALIVVHPKILVTRCNPRTSAATSALPL